MCGFVGLAGSALITSILVPSSKAATGLALVGKFGITGSFILLYVFTTEVVPTKTRATALGLCSLSSRVASIASPLLVDLFPGSRVVLAIMGAMALVAAGMVLLIKETNSQTLGQAPAAKESE